MKKRSYFWKEKTGSTRKKILDCEFIRNYPNKENYDVFYEIGRMQTFISKFKNKTWKELEEGKKTLNEKISL